MANTTRLILTELLILVLGLTLFPTNMLRSNAQQKPDQDAVARRKELLDRKLAQDRRQARLDQMIATFKKTKELLTKKGVPFEPAVLMTPNWRDTLAPHFEHIADMQTVRIGPRRLKGVQMAHTLYLPEEVELVGDTVILARNVIFEGRDAVIRGSFSIALYPVDQTALLGSTLEQALQRTGARFLNANFSSATTRALPANLPVIKGGSLTIDTSGFGYKQWLEQQAAMKRRKGPFVNATFVPQGGEEKNGAPGQPGKNIFSAAAGSDDAFLALDLNQNGMIDSGAELFGNYTPQPHSVSPNGFLALAEFDKEENGGIADGTIDTEDAVYARLLLWRDTNHDGKSDTGELRPLAQSGVTALSLDYKQSKQQDEHDNLFYYRSRIQVAKHSRAEHWAYDVFLVPAL